MVNTIDGVEISCIIQIYSFIIQLFHDHHHIKGEHHVST